MTSPSFWPEEQQKKPNQNVRWPRRPPDRMGTRPATGAACAMCGDPTQRGESEVEIEYDGKSGSGTRRFFLHARCFSIMERGHWSYE
jgi:hypothetical protein